MKSIFIFLLFPICVFADINFTDDSLALIQRLESQKFVCNHTDSLKTKRGLICRGTVSKYSRPVRIYVSPYFKSTSLNLHLHYHGHILSGVNTFQMNASDLNGYGDYGAELVQSQFTGLLIIPESLGNCTTYEAELYTETQFKNFISNLSVLTAKTYENISISGHSGAYRVINRLFQSAFIKQKIATLGLFDAIYADMSQVRNWLQNDDQADNKLNISYVIGSKSTTQTTTKNFLNTVNNVLSKIQVVQYTPEANKTGTTAHMNVIRSGRFSKMLETAELN